VKHHLSRLTSPLAWVIVEVLWEAQPSKNRAMTGKKLHRPL